METNIEWFFDKDTKWQEAYKKLREIILDCGLAEELKWGKPCYTINKSNVVLIHGFKDYCALLFHKGVLLGDPKNILIQQTENVQSARQLRFPTLKEITDLEATIKAYIFEATEVEKAGLEVKMKKTAEYDVPEELEKVLAKNAKLKKAFEALTPGRQRGYYLYFSQAKQSATRTSRIEKCVPKIMSGKGSNEL